MAYVDTSALVALVVNEMDSAAVAAWCAAVKGDPVSAAWCVTEFGSALALNLLPTVDRFVPLARPHEQ